METVYRVIILSAAAAVYGTGLGGAAGAVLARRDMRRISVMLSFAGGLMLSVVCFDLIRQALELSEAFGVLTVPGGIAAGYVCVCTTSCFVCRESGGKKRGAVLVSGFILCTAIALHNFPEGMVIGSSCALDGAHARGRSFAMAAVLGFHNIPEGMAMAVTLCAGGMRKLSAVLLCAAAGIPSVLGALLGWYLAAVGPLALSLSLSFSSGAMLFVVLSELLPEGSRLWPGKAPAAAAFLGLLLGFLIFAL